MLAASCDSYVDDMGDCTRIEKVDALDITLGSETENEGLSDSPRPDARVMSFAPSDALAVSAISQLS